eukprot:EG_transcript_19650
MLQAHHVKPVIGKLEGYTTVINDYFEASWLYSQGHFGKGSKSRSRPIHCDLATKTFGKWRRSFNIWHWVLNIFSMWRQRGTKRDRCGVPKNQNNEQVLLCDVHREVLFLLPEETLYLSALGVLQVERKESDFMDLDAIWELFSGINFDHSPQPDPSQLHTSEGIMCPASSFFARFKVYQHFRSRGWVVRHGLEFGVDFLLYAGGPEEVHAAFGVMLVDSTPRLRDCARWVRLAETVAKNVVLCQTILPAYCLRDVEEGSPPGTSPKLQTIAAVLAEAAGRQLLPLAKVRTVKLGRFKGSLPSQTTPNKRFKV